MFIPPQTLKSNFASGDSSCEGIKLQSGHLIIGAAVVADIFGEALNANLVYYPERHTLLLAPYGDELFTQLHKAKKCMLKGKNAKGDKSIALQGILIDHQIDAEERSLEYTLDKEMSVLTVLL